MGRPRVCVGGVVGAEVMVRYEQYPCTVGTPPCKIRPHRSFP